MKISIMIFVFIFITRSKNDFPCDSVAWNKNGIDWQVTEFKEKMAADLFKSDSLIGLQKPEIYKLIGKSEIERVGS